MNHLVFGIVSVGFLVHIGVAIAAAYISSRLLVRFLQWLFERRR